MGRVYWRFRGDPYADLASFNEAVHRYYVACSFEGWDPDEVVLRCPLIRVMYMCWKRGRQIEPIVELSADGESFTAGELLFKIHNAVVEHLRGMDHVYFEGLSLHTTKNPNQPPLYGLMQGS